MFTSKEFILLILILVIGFLLRFVNLQTTPPGLTWDEVSHGYNAYSILQTGKDEYGEFLPLQLKSFGDFKPAIYTYLIIPFIAVLGLTEYAVRLPSVIIGTATIILLYFFILQIFKDKRLALICSGLLAISPLNVQFSRVAHEANIALFINLAALLFFIKGLKSGKFLILSAVFIVISFFTYQSSRLFLPLLFMLLVFSYRSQIKVDISLKVAAAVVLTGAIFLGYSLFFLGESKRLATVNFFAYQRSEEEIGVIAKEDGLVVGSLQFQFLHGEWFARARGLVERYLIYFSPRTLFFTGDYNPRHRVPDLGMLPYYAIFLLPLGFYYLLKKDLPNKRTVLFWLILAPIPGALSRDLINLGRNFNLTLPLIIIQGMGLIYLYEHFKKSRFANLGLFVVVAVIIFLNTLIFIDRYFIHMPIQDSQGWLYGYKESIAEIQNITSKKNYENIVIADDYGQPYIYYLFYTKYPPESFQRQAVLDQPGVDTGTIRKIDNISFRNIYWPHDRYIKNSLYIGPQEALPDKDIIGVESYKILKEIPFLDGEPAFRIVETQ